MQRNPILTAIGFILFLTGMMALILSVVGAKLSFLVWIDNFGLTTGFVIRLLMIMAGVVLIVMAQPREESQEK